MSRLDGKVVLLTGASRGIGRHLALRLARSGAAQIALVARSRSDLEAVATEVEAAGVKASVHAVDLADASALDVLVEAVLEKRERIDVLVNNAAVEHYGFFDAMSTSEIARQISLNLTAPVALSRLVVPHMKAAGFGHVVSIGSTAGLGGVPYGISYGATKAGLTALTFGLRMEYAGTGVSASVVVPGFVQGAGMFEKQKEDTGGLEPPGMLGSTTVDAVADAVVRAIERDIPEVFVNSLPLRPMVGVGRTFPRLGARIIRSMAGDYMEKLARARSDTGD